MSTLHIPLLTPPASRRCLASPSFISFGSFSPQRLFLTMKPLRLIPSKTTQIRMGGGPRTYPGGVSKWQWKRMQAKKAQQLLKARLARERQMYEMRKRAELKAAVSELERPWEAVEKPPNLFSVSADEQLKVLADRFQKPGGLDLWSESDGPQLFRRDNGFPSARFFPKGAVHSVKPYAKIENTPDESQGSGSSWGFGEAVETEGIGGNGELSPQRKGNDKNSSRQRNRSIGGSGKISAMKPRKKHGGVRNGTNDRNSGVAGEFSRYQKRQDSDAESFEMSLQDDGMYGFELEG